MTSLTVCKPTSICSLVTELSVNRFLKSISESSDGVYSAPMLGGESYFKHEKLDITLRYSIIIQLKILQWNEKQKNTTLLKYFINLIGRPLIKMQNWYPQTHLTSHFTGLVQAGLDSFYGPRHLPSEWNDASVYLSTKTNTNIK